MKGGWGSDGGGKESDAVVNAGASLGDGNGGKGKSLWKCVRLPSSYHLLPRPHHHTPSIPHHPTQLPKDDSLGLGC